MQPMKNIVQQLSGKIKVQAIIWLVIACIQYVLGIVNIVNGIDMYYDEEIFSMIMGILIIIVAVLNTVFSIQSFTYSTKILTKPTGIVSKYRPIGGIIGTLIYNILFGGLIGVVGSIYAFVVRSFVMANELQFAQIEQQCMAQAQRN